MNIAVFIDGLSIPSKEGISTHVHDFSKLLSKRHNVYIFNADRGRAPIAELSRQPYKTVLMPSNKYYDRSSITKICEKLNIDIMFNYNAYYISTVLGPVSQKLEKPLIYEIHDLEEDLYFLNKNKTATIENINFQTKAVEYSTSSRVMSKYDYDKLIVSLSYKLKNKLLWMPVALDLNYKPNKTYNNRLTCLFVGNCSYPPNMESLLIIRDKLANQCKNVDFVAVGRMTDNIENDNANLKLLGEVDSLNSYFDMADIGIAPIAHGSGMKIKLISYLSAGLPVLASPIAARGFPKDESIIIKKCSDFPEYISYLQKNTLSELSKKALNLYKNNYEPSNQLDRIDEFMKSRYRHNDIFDVGKPRLEKLHWLNEIANKDYLPIVTKVTYVG